MNDPMMPERALLTLRRAEEAELNDCPDDLEHQPNIHRIRKVFPFSELKISYLPIANARGIRLSRIRDNIPLRYLGWAPQRSLQDQVRPINSSSERGGRDPHEDIAEARRPSLESVFSVTDGRETAHNNRKDALAEQLLSMLGDDADAVVLLCWGQQYHCSIIPVSISDESDEVAMWTKINQAWYTRRGWWRRYIPFFGAEHVDIVEVWPPAFKNPRRPPS